MMKAEVVISAVKGTVSAPSSKSAMQRYIAAALLAKGVSQIFSPSFCDDSLAAIAIAEALGAEISVSDDLVIVHGGFKPKKGEIFCGESGLATRMFTPISALYDKEIIISGKGSVLNRPLKMMERPLADLGVKISSNNGYLPLKIKGPISGGVVRADGSVSSQFITGLLMALPLARKDSLIIVDNLVSKPYIDLTIRILEEFGIEIFNDDYETFTVKGNQKYSPGNFTVEGDWSGAAFLLVLGAIGGEVEITNLDAGSSQADKAIFEALLQAGAKIRRTDKSIIVAKSDLHGFEFDISDCPDLAPPLAVLGLACKGKTIIKGTGRLTAKESNRGKTLEASLTSIGAKINNLEERIEIEGCIPLQGGTADSHNDHRIAMALAIAAFRSKSPVCINGMECINKSYPGFINDFINLGGNITLT
jgi:3-phosphoshikimate 1-carboxyvinyltransferase